METAISRRIYERWQEELEASGEDGERLAAELRRLSGQELQNEQEVLQIYRRLATPQ